MLGEDARPSDIAVIGLACRFPGAVSADDYWRLLAGGGSAVRPATTERWEAGELPPPAMAGFIRDHDRYDPGFFGISLAEARAMDPQPLLALQVTWHALEDARLDPARLAGRDVGATPRCGDCASRPGRRFFVPGDLGYFDADGYLVVLDRDTDTRWPEGERWFPSAMEAELLEHTRCAELAVSLQLETGPEPWPLQVDWVGSEADEEALRSALRLHYPQFQASLARRERLPRNGMGKLLRPQLTPESQHA